MKKRFLALGLATLVLAACGEYAGKPVSASGVVGESASVPAGLETETKQLSYLIGYEIAAATQMSELKNAGIELDYKVLVSAMQEQVAGKESKLTPEQTKVLMESVGKKVQETAEKAASEAVAVNQKFFDENKTKEGVQSTDSGLQYKVNQEGKGVKAELGDMVSVEYEGRLLNGEVFDSTAKHGGQPVDFPLVEGATIPGWTEALSLMKEGDEYTVYIPSDLGYGAMALPNIPAHSALVFDIKLVKVTKGGAKAK